MTVTSVDHAVRPARRRDLTHLGPLEDSGLALFEEHLGDLSGTALAAPAASGEQRAEKDGFILVAGDPPVGFAHVLFLEGHAPLEQLSVHPDHGRRGIGAALVEAVCERLAAHGHGAITLMTYADLPWNAPFYARLGFVEVGDDEPRTGYQLRLVETETRLGLGEHGRRVLMRRALRRHRTAAELAEHLPVIDAAPQDGGTVRLVVRRPAPGVRDVLEVGQLDLTEGLVGDSWISRPSSRSSDGGPHPDMQLTVMSHRVVELLAQDPEREPLAGDQLYLDLDLSEANLPVGTLLHLGADGAVIEVTAQPHSGCAKLIARFGKEAMTFLNGPEGRPRRLRGLCAKVVAPGPVRPGDHIAVERPS